MKTRFKEAPIMTLAPLLSLQPFANRFVEAIPRTPTGRYVSLIMLRETKSYAVFTTEGGEQQDTERTQAGLGLDLQWQTLRK